MLSMILAPALLLLAGGMPALAQETGTPVLSVPTEGVTGVMSILPIDLTSSTDSVPTPTNDVVPTDIVVTDTTGVMSIPSGETPLLTNPLFTNSSTTVTSTETDTTTSSPSTSDTGAPEETGAASPAFSGYGVPLQAVIISGLLVSFGFGLVML